MLTVVAGLALLFGTLGQVAAQTAAPPLSEVAKGMVGSWELSNADRDRTCTLTFRLDTQGPGRSVALDGRCATAFPLARDTAAWQMSKDDALRLVDAKGKVLIEFTEVEAGMFEATPPGDSLLFLQTLAGDVKERIADDFFGEWAITRGSGKAICQFSLIAEAADMDSFVLKLKPGCDPQVTRFGPMAWKLDRGQFVMLSSKGETWRFEESEPQTWRRIPEARPPIVMVKQQP